MTVPPIVDFELRDEFIPLDALLKTTGVATSGGTAKAMVAAGQVQVDGQLELRKRCKIRVGQVVTSADTSIRVIVAAPR
jgi:ribosome-associated protein